MADISSTIKQMRFKQSFQGPVDQRPYRWDPVNDGTASHTTDSGVHDLVAIDEGDALVRCTAVVTEAFTSGGSATVTFDLNGVAVTAAIAVAALTVGTVIDLGPIMALTASNAATLASVNSTGENLYVDGTTVSSAKIGVTVGTATLTAGKAVIIAEVVDVTALQVA